MPMIDAEMTIAGEGLAPIFPPLSAIEARVMLNVAYGRPYFRGFVEVERDGDPSGSIGILIAFGLVDGSIWPTALGRQWIAAHSQIRS